MTQEKTRPAVDPRGVMPLFVDLDGTLVRTDVAQELLVRGVVGMRHIGALAGAALRGRSQLKVVSARLVEFRADLLPYRQEVLDYIAKARKQGRPVILATAADTRVAQEVAEYLQIFDGVLASDQDRNLKGAAKLDAIKEHCAGQPFEYLGDSGADIAIWQQAERPGFVAPQGAARAYARQNRDRAALVVDAEQGVVRALWKAMRPHQWVKNALIFLPLIVSHNYTDPAMLLLAALAFVAFSLCASSVYLVNDLVDIEADRVHATKRNRPFAAGTLRPLIGVVAALGMTLFALIVAFGGMGPVFGLVLLAYMVLTTAYSLWLKQYSTVDVIVLALLYTMRIVAGAAACMIVPSEWLLSFSLFFFLSLAYMKRYIELARVGHDRKLPSRNYQASDLTVVQTFGIANGALALLTLAQYMASPQVRMLYSFPQALWLVLPLMMFWTYRTWMWASRGKVGDDPVVFAIKDRISQITVVLVIGVILLARNFQPDWIFA